MPVVALRSWGCALGTLGTGVDLAPCRGASGPLLGARADGLAACITCGLVAGGGRATGGLAKRVGGAEGESVAGGVGALVGGLSGDRAGAPASSTVVGWATGTAPPGRRIGSGDSPVGVLAAPGEMDSIRAPDSELAAGVRRSDGCKVSGESRAARFGVGSMGERREDRILLPGLEEAEGTGSTPLAESLGVLRRESDGRRPPRFSVQLEALTERPIIGGRMGCGGWRNEPLVLSLIHI